MTMAPLSRDIRRINNNWDRSTREVKGGHPTGEAPGRALNCQNSPCGRGTRSSVHLTKAIFYQEHQRKRETCGAHLGGEPPART